MRTLGIIVLATLGIMVVVDSAMRLQAAADVLNCRHSTPTITGSGTITGTPGDDVIIGSAGDDVIKGLGGDDLICGAGGSDVIDGGSGNDQLAGEAFDGELELGLPGADKITGSSGNDFIVDVEGRFKTLDGGSGHDEIIGGGGINGRSGNDNITILILDSVFKVPFVDGGSGSDMCQNPDDVAAKLVSCESTS
jgi:Ca2+-binding RTX toxin-like protein